MTSIVVSSSGLWPSQSRPEVERSQANSGENPSASIVFETRSERNPVWWMLGKWSRSKGG